MHAALSALVIHDIKNSLALLEIDLEQLNHHAGMPVEAAKAYQRCVELKRRLVSFLTLYKHDQGGLQANVRVVVLEEFLEDLLSTSLSVQMRDPHHPPIQVRIARERIAIAPSVKRKGSACLDEYLLDMALESALNNACRYARRCVDVWFEQTVDRVIFYVSDDGPGVTQNDALPQRSPHEHSSSTGLGLALCDAVAQAHGAGTVALTNAPQRGALFRLSLPLGV